MKMETNQMEGLDTAAGSSFGKASAAMLPADSDGDSLVKIEPDLFSEGLVMEGIKIKEEFIPDEQEAEESFSFISCQGADCIIKQEPTGIETSTIEVTSVTSLADQVDLKSSSQHTGTNFETIMHLTDELYSGGSSPHQCSIAQESIVVKEEVVFTQENGSPYSTATENYLAAMITDIKTESDPLGNGDEWDISDKVINDVPQGVHCNDSNLSPPNSSACTGSDGVFHINSKAVEGGENCVSPYNLASENNCSSPHTSTKKLDPALSAVLTVSEGNSANSKASEDCEDYTYKILETKKRSYHLSYLPGRHRRIQRNRFDVLCHEQRDLKRKLENHGREQREVAILAPHSNAQLISCDVPALSLNEASQKIHSDIILVSDSNSAFLDEEVEVDSNESEGIVVDFNHQETEQISNGASNSRQIRVTSKSNPADNLTISKVNLCKTQTVIGNSSQLQTFSLPISGETKLISCGTSTMSLKEVVLRGQIATALYVNNSKPNCESKSNSKSLKRKLRTDHARYQQKLAIFNKSNTEQSLCSYKTEIEYHSPAELTPVSCNSSNHKPKMKIIMKDRENIKLRNFGLTPSEVALSSQNDLILRRDQKDELIVSNAKCLNEKSDANHINDEGIIVSTSAGSEFIPNDSVKIVLDNYIISESDVESLQNISTQTLNVDDVQSKSCSVPSAPLSETKSEKNIPGIPQKPIFNYSSSLPQSSSVLLSTKVHPRKSSLTKTTPSILRKLVSNHSQTTPQSCLMSSKTNNNAHHGETKVRKRFQDNLREIFSSSSSNLLNPQKSETVGACDSAAEPNSSQPTVRFAQSSCASNSESDAIPLPTNTTSFSSLDTLKEQTLCSSESSNLPFTSRDESNFLLCKPQSDSTTEPAHGFSSPASNASSSFHESVPPSESHPMSMAEEMLDSFLHSSDTMSFASHSDTSVNKPHSGSTTKHNNNFVTPTRSSSSVSRRKSAIICKRDSEPTLFCLFSDSGPENRNENKTIKPIRKTRFGVLKDLFARRNNSVPILSDAEANNWLTLNMLTCRRCDTSFKTVKSCIEHIEDHLWDKYVCNSCPRSFQCENLYKKHLKTHACSKFVCETCHASFWSLRAYTVHSKQPCIKSIKCSLCHSYFDPEDYESHLAYAHFKI